MDEIAIGMVAPAIPCFPVWVAQRNGHFADQGIVADVLLTGATDKVTQALREHDCHVAIVAPEGVISDVARGGTLRLIAGNANKAPLTLIGLPSVSTIADLRGRRIGTTSLQEGTAILVQRMLAAHGLHYPGDYAFELAGAHPQRWQALQAGTIDAALQLIPFDYMAQEAGFSTLGAARDYVPDYAFSAVAVDLGWAQPNRGLARRVLRALRESVAWSRDHLDETAEIVVSETRADPAHAIRALSDLIDGDISPGDLRIVPEALEEVIAATRQAGLVAADAPVSYATIVDESFAA